MSRQVLSTQALSLDAWVRLLRGSAAATRALSADLQGEHGLTINDYEALLALSRAEEGAMRRVDLAGGLLLTASGVTGVLGAGTTPLDLDVSQDSKFLYVLKAGVNTVGAFAVNHDGTLNALADGVGGLTSRGGQMGIAAY